MAKIIKLTESQFKDIVSKVIMQENLLNEEAKYFTSKAAQEIWLSYYHRYDADLNAMLAGFQHIQSLSDFNVGNKEIAAAQGGKYPNGFVDVLNDNVKANDLAIAQGIKAALARFGVNLQFRTYNNGKSLEQFSFSIAGAPAQQKTDQNTSAGNTLPDVTVTGYRKKGTSGNVKTAHTPRQEKINNMWCSVKNGVIVNPSSSYNNYKWSAFASAERVEQWEIDLAKASCPQNNPTTNKKATWVKNNGFPLKYGQYGDLIKQLQAVIGQQSGDSKVYDGYFGNKTEALVKMYYPTYDRATGVTQEMFNTRPTNPMDKTKFNTNLNRFNTQPPAGGTPPVAGAPVTK